MNAPLRKAPRGQGAVAVYGDNCVDRYTAPQTADYIGGNAVNVAVHLAAQGANAAYFGVTGDDWEGEIVRRVVMENGVNTDHLKIRQGETALTWIEVRDGERIVLGDRTGVQCPLALAEEELCSLARFPVVHCTAFTAWNIPIAEAQPGLVDELRYLAHNGAFVSLDFSELVKPALAQAAGSSIGAAFVSGGSGLGDRELRQTAKFYLDQGVQQVVITLGREGAVWMTATETARVAAFPVKVVDTLGAGDAFVAGWLYGKLIGEDPVERLRRGAEVAGRVCEYFGAWPQSRLTTPGTN